MKFTCEKNAIVKEISIAQDIISSKQTLTVTSNIYLETIENSLIIKASDANVSLCTKVPVFVGQKGKIMVKADTFLGILNSVPDGEIEFENTDVRMSIRPAFKKIKFNLRTMYADQFPEFETSDGAVTFEMPIEEFKDMVKQTIFSVSDDQMRYFMNGIFFEKYNNKFVMVATDGRRMAYAEKDIVGIVEDFDGVIIPEKILNLVLKHASNEGNISISVKENMIFISFGSIYFSSKLIEGQFPNYKRVIPENLLYNFVVSRKEVLDAFKRVVLLVEKKSKRILFKLSKNSLSIISDDNETGTAEENIECKYEGEETTIAFNYGYIEEPFKIMSEDEVIFYFSDVTKALTVKPIPESYFFHVLMPMQI